MLGGEPTVTAPLRSRRMLGAGAAVVAAGAAVWLVGNLMMIFGYGTIQLVQSPGGGATAVGGPLALAGGYGVPFTVLGIASIVVGAGYLVYASGLVWPGPRSGSLIGFGRSRSNAVIVAILFLVNGSVAIAVIPLLSSSATIGFSGIALSQGLIAWLIAAIILVVAASRHYAFLRDLRIETGITEKLGGRGLRAFSKVALAVTIVLLIPLLLSAYANPSGAGAGGYADIAIFFVVYFGTPILFDVARLLEFFVLPILGVAVFGLMIPKTFRLTAVGKPPVVRATMPVGAPSPPVGGIQPEAAKISVSGLGAAGAIPENPSVPLPAVMAPSPPAEESWVLAQQAEIATLEKALREQKDSLSQLDEALQDGRINRDRFEELEGPGLERIAELENDVAERRQRLPKGTPENPQGELDSVTSRSSS